MKQMTVTAFAPGRVNLIGEHTDYNGGLALPFAIAEGATVRAWALGEGRVEVVAADLGETDRFTLGAIEAASGWRAFVRGVAAELSESGLALPGMRLEIRSSVPAGAGLASSAALTVALALALAELAGPTGIDRMDLARLCSRVENVWVGAHTGLLDQLAALFGQRGRALAIDFETHSVRPVSLELEGHRLVLLDSGEKHSNAGHGYNQRRAECEQACEGLGITSLRAANADGLARLPEPLSSRVRHVIEENERVLQAVDALDRGDWPALGELLDASHASSRDLYGLSTPAVEAAVRRLRRAGALGARLVGAGFGGHVLGLFPPGAELPPDAFEVRPSGGAWVQVIPTRR
jgi:galactokinase